MSWNINIIGKPADVKAAVLAADYLPQPLKDTVALFVDAGKDAPIVPPGAIQVKTSGHYDKDSAWSNVYEFSINPVTLAAPVPTMAGSPAAPVPPGGWPKAAEPPSQTA